MVCSKCGRPLEATGAFCGYCGEPIPGRSAARKNASAPQAPAPAPGSTVPLTPTDSPGATVPLTPQQGPGATVPLTPQQGPGATVPLTPQQGPGATVPLTPQQSPVSTAPASVSRERAVETAPLSTAGRVGEKGQIYSQGLPELKPQIQQIPVSPIPEKPKVAKRGAGKAILSVFLSILLLVALTVSTALTVVRMCLSEDTLRGWIEKMEPQNVTIPGKDGEEPLPLIDYVYEELRDSEQLGEISREQVEAILDSDAVSAFLADEASAYTGYILKGEESEGITPESVTQFLKNNEEELRQAARDAGVEMEFDLDYDAVQAELEDSMGDGITVDALDEDIIETVRFVLSTLCICCCWGVTALLLLGLILINRKFGSALLGHIGIPVNVSGLIILLPTVALIVALAIAEPFGQSPDSIVWEPFRLMRFHLLIAGGGLTLTGIILLIIRAIVRSRRKKASHIQ